MFPKEKNLKNTLEKLKESKKRNFSQSVDLIINLKDVDLNNPENRISEKVNLPHRVGKERKIVFIGDGELARKARDKVDKLISKNKLEELSKNKREAKKLAENYDFFLAQPEIMSKIARSLGPILGPREKMPEVIPPRSDLEKRIKRLRTSVRIKAKKQPVIHTIIGTEDFENEKLVENAMEIFKNLERNLQAQKIGKVFVKLSMGEPVKVQ